MKEIVENNKLIAEFMGWKPVLTYNGHAWDMPNVDKSQKSLFGDLVDTKENGKYHTSWDWLMPVVERIVGLELPPFSVGGYMQSNIIDNLTQGIGIAHKTVVEFIKWYNQQES